MPLRLSEHLEQDRPRERLWLLGASALTAQELLAILLGTGVAGQDALAVAGDVLSRVDGSVRRLAGRPPAELAGLPGVTGAEARGEAVVLTCSDSDAALRALLPAYPQARDIEVTGAGLEEAFLQLTGDEDVR